MSRSKRRTMPPRSNACWQSPASALRGLDRKSTRLNSSHGYISYAVFCLKQKDEDVGAADRLEVAAVRLAVRERLELDRAQLDADLLGDAVRGVRMAPPGEAHKPLLRPALEPVARFRMNMLGHRLQPREARQLSRRHRLPALHARRPILPW